MEVILRYLKDNFKIIITYIIFSLVFLIVFFLYNLPLEPVIYAFIICTIIGLAFVIIDIYNYFKKHRTLKTLEKSIIYSIDNLPDANTLEEEDYKELVNILFTEKARLLVKSDIDLKDMVDYYTMWAHQIKTPIAAMKILIQSGDNHNSSQLLNELFKIEQYVEMVLGYLRLGDMSSDLVLETYPLDNIVKQVIRKYAQLFVGKKIKLNFHELNTDILTDEKWLMFVIEQIISNAIKYTNVGGEISIYMDEGEAKTLIIEDSGIGIAAEDLPRVFEKGFTGFNGRSDKKSTGIGLYLCKSILKKLSHKIYIESEVGSFTKVKINLETFDLTKV